MSNFGNNICIIAKREFAGYFATPLALVFIVIFLALTGAFAFYVGGFFSRGNADRRRSLPIIRGCFCFWFRPSACGFGRKSGNPGPSSF